MNSKCKVCAQQFVLLMLIYFWYRLLFHLEILIFLSSVLFPHSSCPVILDHLQLPFKWVIDNSMIIHLCLVPCDTWPNEHTWRLPRGKLNFHSFGACAQTYHWLPLFWGQSNYQSSKSKTSNPIFNSSEYNLLINLMKIQTFIMNTECFWSVIAHGDIVFSVLVNGNINKTVHIWDSPVELLTWWDVALDILYNTKDCTKLD